MVRGDSKKRDDSKAERREKKVVVAKKDVLQQIQSMVPLNEVHGWDHYRFGIGIAQFARSGTYIRFFQDSV